MANLVGDSMNPNVAAVFGNNTVGTAVFGVSTSGAGVAGRSQSGLGVYANSSTNTALYAEAGSGGEAPAVLVVKQMGGGYLINGLDRGGNRVFEVSAMGGVSIAGGIGVGRSIFVQNEINAGGDIRTNGDVFARGVKLTCDKNAKENFSSVNTLEILDKLSSMPIQSWAYKDDTSSERHIGPIAQDFHAAFGFNGDDDTHISSIDLQGVALVAIQGLNEKLKAENDELHAKLASLEERLFALESKG